MVSLEGRSRNRQTVFICLDMHTHVEQQIKDHEFEREHKVEVQKGGRIWREERDRENDGIIIII